MARNPIFLLRASCRLDALGPLSRRFCALGRLERRRLCVSHRASRTASRLGRSSSSTHCDWWISLWTRRTVLPWCDLGVRRIGERCVLDLDGPHRHLRHFECRARCRVSGTHQAQLGAFPQRLRPRQPKRTLKLSRNLWNCTRLRRALLLDFVAAHLSVRRLYSRWARPKRTTRCPELRSPETTGPIQ